MKTYHFMFNFLLDADIYLKTFWYIAMPISFIFIIQAILTFMGAGGGDTDVDVDSDLGHDAGSMEYFTVRNIINFLLGFSWSGISFYQSIENKFLLILAAITVGIIFVTVFFYILQKIKKLEENNSFNYAAIIGKEAEVYLRIPPPGEGNGLIQVASKGAVRELSAISDEGGLETGEKVLILDLLDDNKVLVKKV